jgi:hypothetical protein
VQLLSDALDRRERRRLGHCGLCRNGVRWLFLGHLRNGLIWRRPVHQKSPRNFAMRSQALMSCTLPKASLAEVNGSVQEPME